MKMRATWLLTLALAACTGKTDDGDDDDGGDDSGADDSGADDTAGGDGGDGGDDPSPVITAATLQCSPGTSSPDSLIAMVTVEDPQGVDTLATQASLRATSGGGEVFNEQILVCGATGSCTGSFRDGDYDGISCDTAPDFTFEAQVTDEDGNASEWATLEWLGR